MGNLATNAVKSLRFLLAPIVIAGGMGAAAYATNSYQVHNSENSKSHLDVEQIASQELGGMQKQELNKQLKIKYGEEANKSYNEDKGSIKYEFISAINNVIKNNQEPGVSGTAKPLTVSPNNKTNFDMDI